jgi:hypothetical protein
VREARRLARGIAVTAAGPASIPASAMKRGLAARSPRNSTPLRSRDYGSHGLIARDLLAQTGRCQGAASEALGAVTLVGPTVAGGLAHHVESRSAVKAAACPVVLALIIVFVEPSRSSAAPTSSPRAGCQIKGDLISGRGLGTPPPSFIRVTSKDGSLNEILPLPSVQSDMIQTESLIRGPSNGDEWVDVNCAAVNPVDAYGNVALSRDPCDYRNYTIVDNGPKATFAGAARSGSAAVIRVKVVQEKFFTSGIFTLDDWVGFSVDGSPEVALPAKGVEPVYVTAYFPYLKPGRHYVAITVFEGFIDEGAPAGTVCL